MKKISITIVIAFLLIGSLVFSCLLFRNAPLINPQQIEKEFIDNKEEFVFTVQQLNAEPYDNMEVDFMDKKMYIIPEHGGGWSKEFDKEKFNDIIEKLYRRCHYSGTVKKGEMIYFYKSVNLDNAVGIVYTSDNSKIQIEFLTDIIPLSEPNWYYYEADFNKWKRENKKQ
jgi:hypothetical protein